MSAQPKDGNNSIVIQHHTFTCIGIMTEDASSPADGINVECSAITEESMALLMKSSSWMVPSSSWKVVTPIWALVRMGISLDLDMKLPVCVCSVMQQD